MSKESDDTKKRDDAFEAWWKIEDESLPWFIELHDDVRKKDAKRIWDAAFKEGGRLPWHSVTKEQLIALFNHHGLTIK